MWAVGRPSAPWPHSATTPGTRTDALRLRLRPLPPQASHGDEGPPRRQGGQPGRDDLGAGPAGAARVHHRHHRLSRLHGGRLARRADRRGGQGPGPAREDDGQADRRSRRPPAGVGAVRGQVLHARDDGHRPQPRPQRPVGRGPGQADRRRAVRLRLLPAVHRHVRPHRAGHPRRGVRRPPRRGQGTGRDHLGRRGARSSSSATWSTPTSRSSSATPASPSPRTPTSSCAGPSRPSSPRGTGRGPWPTGSASASPTTWAPRSTCRPWCSATATTPRGPGWASPATRPPVPPASTATSWSTPRARTWWPASATPSRCRP